MNFSNKKCCSLNFVILKTPFTNEFKAEKNVG